MDDLEDIAAGYYTDLPYHDEQHMQEARTAAQELVERCEQAGVAVDAAVVDAAAAFHDAGYERAHTDPDITVAPEVYSADIAREELATNGYDDGFIDRVEACIMATKPDHPFDTVEQQVVRAADLSGLMADYDTFRENAEALREEHAVLYGETLPQEEWVAGVVETVLGYLGQDIHLTDEHDAAPGISAFHARAGRNLGLFVHEYGDREMLQHQLF